MLNSLQDLDGGVGGIGASAKRLDREEGAADAHDQLAVAGGDGGADPGIDVEGVADDGGIANASGELVGHPAGTAGAGEHAV